MKLKYLVIFTFLPVFLFSQNTYPDTITTKFGKKITCKIDSIHNDIVFLSSINNDKIAKISILQSISIYGLGVVFTKNDGFKYDNLKINTHLEGRREQYSKVLSELRPKKDGKIEINHEFYLSTGVLTTVQLIDIMKSVTVVVGTLGNLESKESDMAPIQLGYRISMNPDWSFGVDLIYEKLEEKYFDNGENVGFHKAEYYTAAVTVSYSWLEINWVQIYSGMGLGITHLNQNDGGIISLKIDPETFPAIHLNLLGLSVGNKINFHLELGGGYKGILSAGVSIIL
jgi:opacity protein-like surface antigen